MSALLERRFEASPSALKAIREAIRDAVRAAGVAEAAVGDLVLAVDEACQNIIRHAYGGEEGGEIELVMKREGADLVIDLRDFAEPVDPDCVKRERDLAEVKPGGLGTHFMRSVMDEVAFVECSKTRGNLLRMRKRIDAVED
jgi:sigma-B regulation protein RsbU (phosphoserine phosphatase)